MGKDETLDLSNAEQWVVEGRLHWALETLQVVEILLICLFAEPLCQVKGRHLNEVMIVTP